MKDPNDTSKVVEIKKQSKNYRKIYKDFFGIDFSSDYVTKREYVIFKIPW